MRRETETTVKAQCEALIRQHFPEGLLRTLERRFPAGRFQDCEDAVAEGFLRLLVKGEPLENPAGYVATVAINRMQRLVARAARDLLPEGDPDADEMVDQLDDPTADEAIGEAMFEFVRAVVDGWESRNVKTATLLVLEATKLGEPITGAELAREMEDQLGEDVLPDTARQWRKRGLDRLRKELHEVDYGLTRS